MLYRKLGRTNLKVSVIGLGGGAFFGSNKSVDQASEVISYLVNNGVNFIETGEEYDESKFAPGLKGIRDEVILASKSISFRKKDMESSLKNSLKKLETNHINIYMLQTVTTDYDLNLKLNNGTLDVLKKARVDGLIDFIGLSGHRIPVLINAIKTNEFDVVEVPYSIGQTETEKLFEIAKEFDVGIIAITTLGGGILVDRDKKTKATDFMNPKNALGYVLSNRNVATALVGMSSIEHAKENINAVETDLTLSELERKKIVMETENFLGSNFCRSCKACMPCDEFGWRFSIDNFLRYEIFFSKYGYKHFILEYQKLDMKADACTECGKCESRCPYGIQIRKKLKTIHKILSNKKLLDYFRSKEKIDELLRIVSSCAQTKQKGKVDREFNKKINSLYDRVSSFFKMEKMDKPMKKWHKKLSLLHEQTNLIKNPIKKDEKMYELLNEISLFYRKIKDKN